MNDKTHEIVSPKIYLKEPTLSVIVTPAFHIWYLQSMLTMLQKKITFYVKESHGKTWDTITMSTYKCTKPDPSSSCWLKEVFSIPSKLLM